jgi:YHS domain-containing protein
MKNSIAILTAVLLGSTLAFAGSGVPKSYPLTQCVISEEKLGDHGKPVKVASDGTDVWLCCKSCIKDFNKAPANYVKRVKDAEAKKK